MNGRNFLNKIRRGVNAYDYQNADVMAPIVTNPAGAKPFTLGGGMAPGVITKGQIQLLTEIRFYTENGAGVYAQIAAAALPVAAQIQFPFFYFANSDFASGWAQLQGLNPVAPWAYGNPIVWGKQVAQSVFPGNTSQWSTVVTAGLLKGDIVQQFTVNIAAQNYLATVRTRCGDVPLATLQSAINSNVFKINLIRYNVADDTATNLAQYRNRINISSETMFGKLQLDKVNPNSSKSPNQLQRDIIDMEVDVVINKEKGLATLYNFDAGPIEWNLSIEWAQKIQ